MEDGEIYVVRHERKFFLNKKAEISTTGMFPPRGFYVLLALSRNINEYSETVIWLDSKNNEITNDQWIKKLNDMASESLGHLPQ